MSRARRCGARPLAVLTEPLSVPLAPALLPWIHRGLSVGVLGAGVALTVVGAGRAWQLALLVPAATALVLLVIRVGCELALGLAAVPARTAELAAGLARVEDDVERISRDMPRLGFLRIPSLSGDRGSGDG